VASQPCKSRRDDWFSYPHTEIKDVNMTYTLFSNQKNNLKYCDVVHKD